MSSTELTRGTRFGMARLPAPDSFLTYISRCISDSPVHHRLPPSGFLLVHAPSNSHAGSRLLRSSTMRETPAKASSWRVSSHARSRKALSVSE